MSRSIGRLHTRQREHAMSVILTCRGCGATKPAPDGTPTDHHPSDHWQGRGRCLLSGCECGEYEAKKKPRPSRAKKATS